MIFNAKGQRYRDFLLVLILLCLGVFKAEGQIIWLSPNGFGQAQRGDVCDVVPVRWEHEDGR